MNIAIWIQGKQQPGKTEFTRELMSRLFGSDMKCRSTYTFKDDIEIMEFGLPPEHITDTMIEYARANANGNLIHGDESGTSLHRNELKELATECAVPFQLTSLLANHFKACSPQPDTIPNLVRAALFPRKADEDNTPPEQIRTLSSDGIRMIVTEGERAAEFLTSHGIPAIAVPGHTQIDSLDKMMEAVRKYEDEKPIPDNPTPQDLQTSITRTIAEATQRGENEVQSCLDSIADRLTKDEIIGQALKKLTTPEIPTLITGAGHSDPAQQQAADAELAKRYVNIGPIGPKSPTSSEELPDLHAGLTYPKDEEYLTFLNRHAPRAQAAVGYDGFQNLRQLARQLGRTDREVIDCIHAFRSLRDKKLEVLSSSSVIAAVTHSLKASAIAEITAQEAAENLAATHTAYTPPSAPNAGASQSPTNEGTTIFDKVRRLQGEAAMKQIQKLLSTDFAGLRITPTQAAELCNRIQMHATLPES